MNHALKLEKPSRPTITLVMGNPKPSQDEVIKYALPLIRKFISEKAADSPSEHKEEIEQNAMLRVLEAYPRLDPDAGWKSYVYNHCKGAVLDYLKFGLGFAETSWSLSKEEEHDSRSVSKIRTRVSSEGEDGTSFDVEDIAGFSGVFTSPKDFDTCEINWDLIARMASVDQQLHVFAKWLRGFKIEEIGPVFELSRARIGQLITAFVERMDDGYETDKPWGRQLVYALGLGKKLGIPHCDFDQSKVFGFKIGTDLRPVDLDSKDPYSLESHTQMSLFDTQGAPSCGPETTG